LRVESLKVTSTLNLVLDRAAVQAHIGEPAPKAFFLQKLRGSEPLIEESTPVLDRRPEERTGWQLVWSQDGKPFPLYGRDAHDIEVGPHHPDLPERSLCLAEVNDNCSHLAGPLRMGRFDGF
jgi:hypothetical protein